MQVNRDLLPEFTRLIDEAEWDVALLQECPPRFAAPLIAACSAQSHRVLTARNSFGALRSAIARLNPDLIASSEGGSNLTLVRNDSPLGRITERRGLVIRERLPERRTMAFVRTASGLCVANLHATNDRPELATPELLHAAETAIGWSEGSPLIFGGDLNLRPSEHLAVFDELRNRFGLAPPTAPDSIDHLLARGLDVTEPPATWPAARRELRENGHALRLSDHAPVNAAFLLR